ncbi:hypothetical protein DSM106972_068510 [Dulcicalothrix desertica PCC 7102]|uniref:G domain-containing protein n=1 Tax=Dulcicalothrix desertica PCC 7102 TaxID=232991 RepID=A0A433V5C8_9CYAN|nr:DUF697 domain-containing protein [Dulcicalothrix desertica]RUT01300.1 hypothetical protein DSM106972_068510 [Dulcicalothrix desertica PCC 7102]TWH40551.1 hypothetical protein CAL7102_09893 [Dulcicalothrix desertica PCC 7102]
MKLQRPILVGGLSLSFALWLFDSLQDSFVFLSEFSLLGLVAVGGSLWLFKQRSTSPNVLLEELPSDRAAVEKAILKASAVVSQLAGACEDDVETKNFAFLLQNQISKLEKEIDREEMQLAVTGGKFVGKSTLINTLQQNCELLPVTKANFYETAPLFIEASNTDNEVLNNTVTSDYVLFVTNGDITDTEYQTLQQLNATSGRIMVVFNKQDQYIPDERASILSSLKQRLQCDVTATSVAPVPIKVRKHNADGTTSEWMEQPAPDIQQLTTQLSQVFATTGQKLIWATTVRKANLLKTEAKTALNIVRLSRATPIIEQNQWIAAAAAFANPLPALDILATAAINAQMVMDLGNVYQQKFSLDQARTVAAEMGGLMLKLGLVELSTKAVSTVLKTNAVTYAVGGVIQGVSAAYLTRVAGLALVEYFQAQEVSIETGNALNLDKLRSSLQNVFQQSQQVATLQGFVSQGVKKLVPEGV